MNNRRHASLVLNSSYLVRNVNNQFGFTSNTRHTSTWYNINLRNLLGDMYEQYDYFNISLTNISTQENESITSDLNNLSIYVRMSGLSWVNNSYNVKTKVNNQYSVMGVINFIRSINTFLLYDNNISTFGKNQDSCNITIDLFRVIDDSLSGAGANSNPITMFMFDIVGVPKTLYLKNN